MTNVNDFAINFTWSSIESTVRQMLIRNASSVTTIFTHRRTPVVVRHDEEDNDLRHAPITDLHCNNHHRNKCSKREQLWQRQQSLPQPKCQSRCGDDRVKHKSHSSLSVDDNYDDDDRRRLSTISVAAQPTTATDPDVTILATATQRLDNFRNYAAALQSSPTTLTPTSKLSCTALPAHHRIVTDVHSSDSISFQLDPKIESMVSSVSSIVSHTTTNRKCPKNVSSMASRTLSLRPFPFSPFSHSIFIFFLCWCSYTVSVISASHYASGDVQPPPYSQYYPAYLEEVPSIKTPNIGQSSRTGKSRVFGKAPTINSNSPSAESRQYLDTTFVGGEISGNKVLRRPVTSTWSTTGAGQKDFVNANYDYRITSDIIVPVNARLELEPGVRVAFAPGIGITVRGTIFANGTSLSNIILTSLEPLQSGPRPGTSLFTTVQSSSTSSSSNNKNNKPIWPNIRLVDGSSITEGRLQISYKGQWHSVCTNSRNWTTIDVKVACAQLGFDGGAWYRWFARNNDTRQFMYESPACRGTEGSIENCLNWSTRRIGSGVCDFHQDIGIRCSRREAPPSAQPGRLSGHWRGIVFEYAESRVASTLSGKMQLSVSRSYLEHVIVENAGIDADGSLTPAVHVHGSVPPYTNELTIRRSAYTSLNITDPSNGFHVSNSRFVENRGYGVYINSSVGRILLSNIEVEENGADGVRFVHFDKSFYSTDSFCQTPNLGRSQVFPIRYTHKQSSLKAPTEECCQEFYSKDWEGQRITAHFPVLISGVDDPDPRNIADLLMPHAVHQVGREGSIYVVDGHSGRVLADFFVRNDTRTQSVSSIVGNGPLRVCYRPAHYRNVLFTVEVVIDHGREYDLVVADSRIVGNNGRGIWLQDLRSGSVINRTLIAYHDYVAGIDVAGGVADFIVNKSVISNNFADGINVTTGGGYLHLDRTEVINNTRHGLAVWFNQSIALQAFNHSSHVTRCTIGSNLVGLRIASGCHFPAPSRGSVFWNVSMNHFLNQRKQSIVYHTCIPRPRILKMTMTPTISNISITHNRFTRSGLHAIFAAPLFFAKFAINNNEFIEHQKAVLYINSRDSFDVDAYVEDAERFPFAFHKGQYQLSNQRKFALDSWPTIVRIRNNNFFRNRGHYVVSVGLLEPQTTARLLNVNSLPQKIIFTRNLLSENIVEEPFGTLNSRSKVSAVLCITSSNVLVWRNEFVNIDSRYELGMHLSAHYRVVNASLNYWGTWRSNGPSMPIAARAANFGDDKNLHSAAAIYERIFDRKNRYNLAQIEFLPYLMVPNALESESLSQVNDREKISQFFTVVASGEAGGEVRGQVNLPPGVYYVKRDIYVSPEGELVLNPGTELRFDQSVGIFVQGKFKAKGTSSADIRLILSTGAAVGTPITRNRRESSNSLNNNNSTKSTSDWSSRIVTSNQTIVSSSRNSKPTIGKTGSLIADRMKIAKAPTYTQSSVRLSNGTEGRLEVRIGTEWGTICGYNFDIEDAAVACHQMGLVLNARDWRLEKSEFWTAGNSRSILLSNVHCSHLDTDLVQCEAERAAANDFEGPWCPMGEVGIRCYPPAWAGVRFGMLTREATVESVTVEKAGLLDYQTRQFVPALQFDFNRFTVRNSIIRQNIDSGIGLMWNDVLSEPAEDKLQIVNSKVYGNLNHGIVTRTQGISVRDCRIAENKASGFFYDPNFSREEQEELTSWVVRQTGGYNRHVSVLTISESSSDSHTPGYNQTIQLEHIGQQVYVYIPRRPVRLPRPYRIMISTSVGHRIGVMAISPIFQTRSSESLKLFSPQLTSTYIPKMMWDLRRNLTAFPFIYPGYRLVLEYSTGEVPYGGVLLMFTLKQYLRAVPGAPTIAEQEIFEQRQMNTMLIHNNHFIENGRGFTAAHCSMNVDFNGNYCKRYGNETILIERNAITKSRGAGIFVDSYAYSSTIPYSLMINLLESMQEESTSDFASASMHDPWLTSSIVAEINYTLIENRLIENGDFGSIVLYDHSLYENGDMQRSSLQLTPGYLMSSAVGANYPSNTNLFHWNVRNCSLEMNRNGGIDIRLPYTWLYNENFTHTVSIEDCRFERNQNFEFLIGGHYAKVNITRNRFLENHCKTGLISITGMEKLMRIEENQVWDNYVLRYVLELNMASHADKFGTVHAFVHRNILRNNRYVGPNLRDRTLMDAAAESSSYSPETYAIAIRGVQQVNVTRNILVNRNLQFELLAGVRAGSLHNELDARENWWGVGIDAHAIRERIFDFDDWNSFASTVFSPWLSSDRVDATLVFADNSFSNISAAQEDSSFFAAPYLGGRLTKSLLLTARDRPYVVKSDLTVMPGVTLTLRPGVVIEFYPSVGILVLGDFAANGQKDYPIKLRPLRRNTTTAILRKRTGDEDISFRLGNGPGSRNRRVGGTASTATPSAAKPHSEKLVFSKTDIGGVRLCLTETCEDDAEREADAIMERKANMFIDSGYPRLLPDGRHRHGYLEIYNTTTLQWAPVCDTRFTERNAQVVCRQMGFSTLNVFVRRGPRLDMDPTLMSRINHWPDALECGGAEATLSDCELRTFSKDSSDNKVATYEAAPFVYSNLANANTPVLPKNSYYKHIFDNETQEMLFYLNDDWTILEERSMLQSTSCRHDGNEFVYVMCGEDNSAGQDDNRQKSANENEFASEHWGGIRFALAAFEEPGEQYVNNRLTRSRMQYVEVNGAGILHGEKSAAIQLVQRSIPLEFVSVERSASHGIEVIAPPESLRMHQLSIRHNLGSGLNLLMLGASESESDRVPYQPLSDGPSFTVPYNAFSLVDICDARKELLVDEKVLVYYKYDNRPVDCVKIFTSANPLKRIGLRFLQVNLWSTFVEPEGKSNTRREDYLQGSKFLQQSEDIFHNKLFGAGVQDQAARYQSSSSNIDISLLNSMSDSVLIWDGDIFNETTRRLLGEVYSDATRQAMFESRIAQHHTSGRESNSASGYRRSRYIPPTTKIPPTLGRSFSRPWSDAKNRLYKSTGYTLSMQLHASGASGRYGFIAEITTLPSAYYAERVEPNLQHNITYSTIEENTGGAVLYRSVGESIPPLALLHNVITRNCRQMWGNFSTCETSTVRLQLQNSRKLYFHNNLLVENRAGGIGIEASSYTAASTLFAELANNLFADNQQCEALYFESGQAGHAYQNANVNRNYFTRNRSPHRSNIVFGRAVVKFRENVILNNYGDSQMFVAGFAHAQSSSSLQYCTRNFFYNNRAVNERGEQSTIIVSTVGQVYSENYLVNPDNNFELSTRNRTIVTAANAAYPLRQQILEQTAVAAVLASAIVHAPNNWWGFNKTSAIEARIRDSHDYYYLIPVEFKPFHVGNLSVLSGSCYGGFEKIADTCFVYVGGRMAYHDARRFCEKDNSSMPFVRAANQAELTRYVYLQQPFFDRRRHPVWVQSFDVPIGACSVLVDGYVRVHRCDDQLPFLCERDPEIGISMATLQFWYQEPLGIVAIVISMITAILSFGCICCWICKSRHRHMEKLERRNSIRASIRSSRSLASMNTLSGDAVGYYTNRKLLHDSSANLNGATSSTHIDTPSMQQFTASTSYRTVPHRVVSANPTVTATAAANHAFINGSISSDASSMFFADPLNHGVDSPLNLAPKQFGGRVNGDMINAAVRRSHGNNSGITNHMMRPSFDLMYENQAFKGQHTPMSPSSFASSRDPAAANNRAWTPDTNSTLDYKVQPDGGPDGGVAGGGGETNLSHYSASSENLHKSIPSSASSESSASSSDSTALSSIHTAASSAQPHRRTAHMPPQLPPPNGASVHRALHTHGARMKAPTLLAPINPPPPPPPIRQSIRGDRTAIPASAVLIHRKSMDPTLLLANELQDSETLSAERELLTFGENRQPRKHHPAHSHRSPSQRQPHHLQPQSFDTDLDSDTIGGSQPLLNMYSSYLPRGPPSTDTQDSMMHYLETSLDGDSFYNGTSRVVSPQTLTRQSPDSRLYASQPLETAM